MKLKPTLKSRALKQVTARDFSGGLDLVDSEFNLTSKYAVDGYNMVPDENGSLQVRWGTRQFADFTSVLSGRIVATVYYFSYVIVVDATGKIAAADGSGTVSLIWSPAVAAALPGTPAGWGTTEFVSFTQFLGELIVANGSDKPVIIDNTLAVRYLQDLASGSNINVPICKYVTTISNYVVMAGDPNKPGRLYISNTGTSGTWVGDAPPNDAITFDVDKYAPDAFGEITGLAQYRSLLVVFFSSYIVTIKLGAFNTATPPVHTPAVDDIIESYGAASHNAIVNTGDVLLFQDVTGVSSIKQTIFTSAVFPEQIARLVDTDMQRTLEGLSRSFLQRRSFAIHNRADNRILFFVPLLEDDNTSHMMRVYALTMIKGKTPSWSILQGWNFQSGCVSSEGRVFLANDKRVYRYGSRQEPILSDYEGVVAYNGVASNLLPSYVYDTLCGTSTLGQGIQFYHEMPQNALGDRTVSKTLHYITMDTQGASKFTVSMYFDDLKKRSSTIGSFWSDGQLFTDGYGWDDDVSSPTISMEFVGGDRGARGVALPTQLTPYRNTDHMGLYAVYGQFKFFKLAIGGTSWNHLKIVSVSLYHQVGSIYYG